MARPVRVRYAPSPTGIPHVGNIRTALFNWLVARRHRGAFIVRIEDTDQARLVEGATDAILESLEWLGLDWDEGPQRGDQPERGEYGPYFQSKRLAGYQAEAQRLIDAGRAYRCYCTPQRLDEMRGEQRAAGKPPGYDRHCRPPDDAPRAAEDAQGLPKVVRFAMPIDGETTFEDAIRGPVTFENKLLDDFVILKSDGFPTYHLAHIVDDHAMEISHVLRADEWVSSAPRHRRLYEALGWEPPVYAHLPIILGPDRSKLSKRHGATSLLEYRDQGFLPEAMMNFLALLGWAYDDKTELFTRDELIQNFSLERIGKAGAIFNREKLEWMNGLYIRERLPEPDLARRLMPVLQREVATKASRPLDENLVLRLVPLIRERIKTLNDAPDLVDFFFVDDVSYPPEDLVQRGMDAPGAVHALRRALERLEGAPAFEAQTLESLLRPLADDLGIKAGQLFGTLRVACTGKRVAPPLFDTMEVLGRARCLNRLSQAIALLESR